MRLLRPGDPVVLMSSGECGIVVWTWPCELADDTPDHYVAFFGKKFPLGKPPRKPYILRCAATSLLAVVTDEFAGGIRWRVPLFAAIGENNLEALRFLLRERVDENVLNGALRRAVVHHGNLAAIRLLLEHGADVNAVDEDGATPLFRAVYNPTASPRVVTALLNAGARVNDVFDVKFRVPPRQHRQEAALHHAASVAPPEIVKLLVAKGAELDVSNKKGITPLMVAAKNGRAEVVKLLVDAGAHVSLKDKCGLTPLDWAKQAERSRAPQVRTGGKKIVAMLSPETLPAVRRK
jgi:hypothetical protein